MRNVFCDGILTEPVGNKPRKGYRKGFRELLSDVGSCPSAALVARAPSAIFGELGPLSCAALKTRKCCRSTTFSLRLDNSAQINTSHCADCLCFGSHVRNATALILRDE